MSLWMILPIGLPVLTITGIWLVYAMALYNQHVCPVHNCSNVVGKRDAEGEVDEDKEPAHVDVRGKRKGGPVSRRIRMQTD